MGFPWISFPGWNLKPPSSFLYPFPRKRKQDNPSLMAMVIKGLDQMVMLVGWNIFSSQPTKTPISLELKTQRVSGTFFFFFFSYTKEFVLLVCFFFFFYSFLKLCCFWFSRIALDNYMEAVKKMACEILEMIADGLKIQPRNVLSKLMMDEQSDSVFRLNHYPPCPEVVQSLNGTSSNVIGFGEHTDPQIISVLRSNNTSGLQISLRDGAWISVPPDQYSFFINVGDSLQVNPYAYIPILTHQNK